MKVYRFLDVAHKWLSIGALTVAAVALFVMPVLITVDVIGRTFGHSTRVSQELTSYLMITLVFMGIAYTQRKGEHVTVRLVVDRFSKRVQRWLYVATSAVTLAFSVWLAWFTLQHALRSLSLGSVSMTHLRFPLWMLEILLPIGLGLLALGILVEILKAIMFPKEFRRQDDSPESAL